MENTNQNDFDTELPEGPDEQFLLHAFNSLLLFVNDKSKNIESQFIARLYIKTFSNNDLRWEDVQKYEDKTIFMILKESLSQYMTNLNKKYHYQVLSMLADLDLWTQNII